MTLKKYLDIDFIPHFILISVLYVHGEQPARKIQTLVRTGAKIQKDHPRGCKTMSRGSFMIDTAPLILRSRLQKEITRHVNDRFKFLENVESSHGKFHSM